MNILFIKYFCVGFMFSEIPRVYVFDYFSYIIYIYILLLFKNIIYNNYKIRHSFFT